MNPGSIVILDFGGQYAHLIASRIRRFGAPAFIFPSETDPAKLAGAAGIILSGGPQSVYDKGSPQADPKIFDLGIPVLGLCYGHQWVAHALGGKVTPAMVKEYGPTEVERVESGPHFAPEGASRGRKWKAVRGPALGSEARAREEALRPEWVESDLFAGLPQHFTAWMSHGDEVSALPPGFSVTASSKDCMVAAMADLKRKIFSIQFHIEVTHTEHGMEILKSFVDFCKPSQWSIESYAEQVSAEIKKEVGDKKVFMLVSGGVDSTVAFTLFNKVLGPERVEGLLVDTGLMRQNEVALILDAFQPLGIKNLHVIDASEEFLRHLKNVYEPEEKRRIIGNTFLDVQKRVFEKMGLHTEAQSSKLKAQSWLLGQGTIYPDTIETGGTKHADKIKTHHNRVDAIQRLIEEGRVIEPLKELYKDEVRQLGEELGLPHDLVWRHPFPGPGLGVRILCAEKPSLPENGEVESGKWKAVRGPALGSEARAREEALRPEWVESMPLPVRSVGVQGDGRTYRHALALFSADPFTVTREHRELAVSIPNASRVYNRILLCTSHVAPFEPVFTPTYLTREVADLLREVDAIADFEMRRADLTKQIWQFPVVLLPFGTKTGGRSIVLRPIESTDAMTAAAFILPAPVLKKMTEGLLKIPGIDAVFLDLTNKPPGTIEWE